VSGRVAVYGHLEAALRAIIAEVTGYCYDRCTEATPCVACRVGHIAACALLGDDWRPLTPASVDLPAPMGSEAEPQS
jgi:hypothetical protein